LCFNILNGECFGSPRFPAAINRHFRGAEGAAPYMEHPSVERRLMRTVLLLFKVTIFLLTAHHFRAIFVQSAENAWGIFALSASPDIIKINIRDKSVPASGQLRKEPVTKR
jgi:hypothetical protein